MTFSQEKNKTISNNKHFARKSRSHVLKLLTFNVDDARYYQKENDSPVYNSLSLPKISTFV